MALIDPLGQVVEFISYEGSTRALDGPAIKRTSTDIGVAEDPDSPAGISLQRVGTGVNGDDFGWAAAMASPGLLNPAQVIFRPIRFPLIVQIGHNFNFSF